MQNLQCTRCKETNKRFIVLSLLLTASICLYNEESGKSRQKKNCRYFRSHWKFPFRSQYIFLTLRPKQAE